MGQSVRLLLSVVTGTRSLLIVALPLLPGGEEAASEARSLPRGHRRLPVSPVVRLERQECGALGGGSLEGGVCDSLSCTPPSVSDSHHSGFVLSPVYQGEGFG